MNKFEPVSCKACQGTGKVIQIQQEWEMFEDITYSTKVPNQECANCKGKGHKLRRIRNDGRSITNET
jgi:DnaJ-class molecular chaperone